MRSLQVRDRVLSELIGVPGRDRVAYDALMPRRVVNLLLVSSLYDCYTMIEDGKFSEMLFSEYLDHDLRFTPSIERVSTAEEAFQSLKTRSFDLVISMARVGEMNVLEFGEGVQAIAPGLPVILLACSPRELSLLPPLESLTGIDTIFVWLGDVRLLLAIVKIVEDRHNAQHDSQEAGVRSIVLVEDSPQFYSSYLPLLYSEIWGLSHAISNEGASRAQKILSMRARPKVLLARTCEEAMGLFERYGDSLLGLITDAAFPREGKLDPAAGFRLAGLMRDRLPDLPVLVQSSEKNAEAAAELGLDFADKNSPTLHNSLREFFKKRLGFGEFVLVSPDGATLSKAPDLRTLEWAIQAVPEEHLLSNARRSDLSAWLMARTEFELADDIRKIVSDQGGEPDDLRTRLINAIRISRERSMAGVVLEYSSSKFEGGTGFVKVGKGSLGGKGRGLAFINSLINTYSLEDRFPGVRIFVPPTMVLTTKVFERFMDAAGLWSFAMEETDDDRITAAFLEAQLPGDVVENLWNLLHWVHSPLAVRSSSLLEDASYQPFAGIYKTFMIPNNNQNMDVRLQELCNAVKMVYASTYHSDPKAYMESLPNRLEEERMAVVIQQVVGRRHGDRLYPNFAGVARSMNFYPMPGMAAEDGVVSVALGLGKTVVDGGRCVRFCPRYPRKPIQFLTTKDYLDNTQKSFLALDLPPADKALQAGGIPRLDLVSLQLDAAEEDGTLGPLASVYSPDNDAISDGIYREGLRLVTMAGVLKGRVFPLPELTSFLLKVGVAASSCPVEIEFAVNLAGNPGELHEFAFLQIRPVMMGSEVQDIRIDQIERHNALCVSNNALGNGAIDGVHDLVYVRAGSFDRARTTEIASEIEAVNARLKEERRPYVLTGPGRWGSSDPWLGIPVRWAQISGVTCIVETGLEEIQVDPSQGSHFFQNIVSFGIGYFTIDQKKGGDLLDLSWLDSQPAEAEHRYIRHLAFPRPLHIAMSARKNIGIILKPEE